MKSKEKNICRLIENLENRLDKECFMGGAQYNRLTRQLEELLKRLAEIQKDENTLPEEGE